MELLCCIALLVGLVSASPYGYTKGGAVAKADASAASGTFGGPAPLPFSIPSGTGYTGSFSKSSSSSFASSSASSSSSSSSFSFGGTANGLNTFKTNNNGALGGCSSGSCHSKGGQGIIENAGSFGSGASLAGHTNNNFAGATSSAVAAGAALIDGHVGSQLPCTGSGCLNEAPKCEGGSCNDLKVHKKCTSGKCDSDKESPSDINDFPGIPLSGSTLKTDSHIGTIAENYNANSDINASYDSKHQEKNNEQASFGYNGSGPKCSHGKCGSSTSANKNPTNDIYVPDSYQNIPQPDQGAHCNSPDCSTGNFVSATDNKAFTGGLEKPATNLSPPSLQIGCITGNCQSGYAVTEPGNPPNTNGLYDISSIRIPNHHQCSNGKCENAPVSGNSDCQFGNCGGASLNQALSASSNLSPQLNPSIGCNTPNCAPNGVNLANNLNIPGYHGLLHTNKGASHSFDKSAGFTSSGLHSHTSSDCSTPNCSPHSPSNPPGYNIPYNINPNIGCNSPNCASGDSSSINDNRAQFGTIPPLSPNKEPSYTLTPTFGTIPHCNSPNCASKPSNNKPYLGTPLSCNSPNCATDNLPTTDDSQTKAPANVNGYVSTGSVPNNILTGPHLHNIPSGIYKSDCKTTNCAGNIPHEQPLKEKLPPYTGGFGGPSGLLKPNELSPPSIVSPGTPSTLVNHDKNLPTYTGGFGAPAGILQPVGSVSVPNTVNTQPNHPSYTGAFGGPAFVITHNTPTTGTPNNGDVKLISGSNTNTPISGFGTPAGTIAHEDQTVLHLSSSHGIADTSKYAESSTNQASAHFGVNVPTQVGVDSQIKPIKPKNQEDKNVPPYTGGFDAPSGLLKPNDYSYSSPGNLNNLAVRPFNEPCSLGNCDSNIGSQGDSQSVITGSKSEALAVSKAEAVAYTGGFGAPPGFLKPYDDGKVGNSFVGGKLSQDTISDGTAVSKIESYKSDDHSKVSFGGLTTSTGKLGVGGTQIEGANQKNIAQAGAISGTFSTGYDGKYGSHQSSSGEDIKLGGDCGKGCGATNPRETSQNGAAAIAQASAVAQASATAGAFSGGYGGIGIHDSHHAGSGANIKSVGGCDGRCDGTSYTSNLPLTHGGGFNAADAKSVAGARSFGGFGSSYSSSSASAHAVSGFATKGGYGKR